MAIEKASPLFGDVTVYPAKDGKQRVEIYIRLQNKVEGMQIGIAIDGSSSMQSMFAAQTPKLFRRAGDNVMEPIVRGLCGYACDFSGDGTISPIYWAIGAGGKEVESLGKLDKDTTKTMPVEGPSNNRWGTGTLLLPALDYFLTEFANAPWIVLLLITDGVIGDLDAVITRSMAIAPDILDGKLGKCKFVLVGVGEEVSEEQIDKIDNMFEGTSFEGKIDLWDGKFAATMNDLQEIWDEVDFGIKLPGNARIFDDKSNEVIAYLDEIPQLMSFAVTEGITSVRIEIAGMTIIQPLT